MGREECKKLVNKSEEWMYLSALEILENNVLQWFGHVERMGEERLVSRAYRETMEGNRGRRRDEGKESVMGRW